MTKFAKYYIRYIQDVFTPYEWENRQDHLSTLFEDSNSIVFGEGEPSEEQKKQGEIFARVFNHRIYRLKCNPDIIVMQLANSIDTPMESNFEQIVAKNEPSLFVIIDNRKDCRTIAIQNRKKAFSAPRRVAQIIAQRISGILYGKYCYRLDILPEYYPADLFEAWKEQEKCAQNLRFPYTSEMTADEIKRRFEKLKDKEYYDDTLMPMLMQMAAEAKKANYTQKLEVMPDDKTTALYVDKTTAYMKNLITFASAIEEPVEIVTKEGAVFKCFVEPEEEYMDKIVHHDLDNHLLEMLFRGRKANGEKAESEDIAKAEADIVEMLDGMKHMSEDIKNKEDAA